MNRVAPPPPTATLAAAAVVAALACDAALAAPRFWAVSPYRVRIAVVALGPRLNDPGYAASLREAFDERLRRGVRPLWQTRVDTVAGPLRAPVAERLASAAPADLPEAAPPAAGEEPWRPDKTIVAVLRETDAGVRVVARERDEALGRWGAVREASAPRLADAPDALLAAVVAAFAPLASIELDPDEPSRVVLEYRGAELIGGGFGAVAAGEVLLPHVRRVDREGQPIPDSVRRVPWTYLVAEQAVGAAEDAPAPDAEAVSARVFSHTRTPFGTRRRGRVEQLALHAPRRPDATTVLRLHDRNDPSTPLSGYEVFLSPPGSKQLERLGRSDARGEIAVPASPDGPVRMAHIRCGASVVASLPIAAGVDATLDTPLLDERSRLAAETKVAALREELVDLVARRRILAARIRQRLMAEDVDTAERLLREAEGLPGLAQFNRRLDQAETLYRADDPTAQRRLDRLFAETRSVLGAALDARETRQLANEVFEAKRAGG